MDVIVNSVVNNDNASDRIWPCDALECPGRDIIDADSIKAPNSLTPGKIIVTGSGTLTNCKAIYHARLDSVKVSLLIYY